MAKKSFYGAIYRGRAYTFGGDWPACRDFIKGKSRVKYKGGTEEYIKHWLDEELGRDVMLCQGNCLYTDGSYSRIRKAAGWGYVLTINDKIAAKSSGPIFKQASHVRGEHQAIIEGLKTFVRADLRGPILIRTDFKPVIHHVRGEWQAKSDSVIEFLEQLKPFMRELDIMFEWVPSHCGCKFNEMADELAKQAARYAPGKGKKAG